MKKILHHIRKQPDHIKTRYVVFFAILATALVVVVWMIMLQLIKRSDDTIKTESPFSIFKEVLKGQVSDFKDSLPEKKESLGDTLGTTPSDAPADETNTEPTSPDALTQPASDTPSAAPQSVGPLPLPQPSTSN